MKRRAFSVSLVLCCGLGLLVGCQAIAGIKDRSFDGDAATSVDVTLAGEAQCKDYCSSVQKQCTGDLAVYSTAGVCPKVCAKLPAGSDDDPKGNTIACRSKQAGLAKSNDDVETYCTKAGPGGSAGPDDASACGSNCESYCSLLKSVCPKDWPAGWTVEHCEERCKGLADDTTLSAVKDHGGDTLQCRLVHVSNAAGPDPDANATHCPHALIDHPAQYCFDPPETALDCDHYCQLVNTECTGDQKVYETNEANQCQIVCNALGAGKVGDQSKDPAANTMGCRLWHAYSAVVDPVTHCPHAGPTGDGHCADQTAETPNCTPYCHLLKKACGTEYKTKFDDDDKKCEAACAPLTGSKKNAGYAVKTAETKPDSLQCRFLHVARVLDGSESSCDDPFGEGTHCHE